MARPALLLNLLALAALTVLPVSAKVLAEGKPSKGFYWQKVEQKTGKVVYLCRSESSSKFQKNVQCEGAGAVKPK
jgi:hypothetical protein